MRIFVIGTGRCGTMTFKKACNHIKNYTNAHEGNTGWKHKDNIFDYPDNHIEIDCRLSYFLPILVEKYPDALYVHLQRERESCIESLSKRKSLNHFSIFHLGKPKDMKEIASIYYDNTVNLINNYLYNVLDKNIFNPQKFYHYKLENIQDGFIEIWDKIQAEGNREKALSELKIKHNKS